MTKPASEAAADRPEVALAALLAEVRGLEQGGRAAEALARLDGASAEMRLLGSYHYARGALLFRGGDLDGASAAFARAIELSPSIAEYYGNLGAVLLERGRRPGGKVSDLQRAAATLERGASLQPKLAFVEANRGLALQLLGRHDDAIGAFERALAQDGDDPAALYNLAASLHALGREEACLAALDRVLAAEPSFVPALRSRAATLARLGRRAEAGAALARYVESCPGASDAAELQALIEGR